MNSRFPRSLSFASLLAALVVAAPVSAEFGGLLNGRLVSRDAMSGTSIEGGLMLGELDGEVDYQYLGARLNFRASPDLGIYGDIGQSTLEAGRSDADGIGFGLGVIYFLDGVFATTDLAVKASYHTVELENDGGFEIDFDALVIEAIVSGKNGIGASGNIGWYANLGMHQLDLDEEDENEIGFGGGLVFPGTSGEFYAGIDIIDEMLIGAGYRHFMN